MPVSISSKEGLLFVIDAPRAELLRSSGELGAVKGLQDLRQPRDARIGIDVAGLEIVDLALQSIDTGRFSAIVGSGKTYDRYDMQTEKRQAVDAISANAQQAA
ncbi:hypothetical protein A5906_30805 [Bradyrhizobium sacchari]|uniref:Uncharacterized protein n=1 Tax=Bradyrhizobium sacchari TaxID=1399419 RepID=A0A560JZL1_9BRAD|nr:hypothetical protein A5906_30805 [Bradyrhizobium sacchari]TWB60430.1 hypothetical protein FBZ94_104655 [Bradyrhizobium sacchari]TWB73760.1 hypothetical protein FBZ95_10510 [Bradyrhizobium sacchari]